MTHRLALAVAALLAVVLLVACSGEGETASPPATPTTAAPSPATGATATASSEATASATTPASSPTAEPSATAEARPNDETVASTVDTPLEDLDIVEFTNSAGQVATLPIEVPPRSEYGIGLSGRYALAGRGMLFHYSDDREGPFWMKNTHIDLAIAFIDAEFRIVEIREMSAESEDLVTPASQYRYAVEAPSGWYTERAIEAGDQARFLFELPDR